MRETHTEIETMLLYIQFAATRFKETVDRFTVRRVAKTPNEIDSLLEVGFESVCEIGGWLYLGNLNKQQRTE